MNLGHVRSGYLGLFHVKSGDIRLNHVVLC
jgi:hypothetical protein